MTLTKQEHLNFRGPVYHGPLKVNQKEPGFIALRALLLKFDSFVTTAENSQLTAPLVLRELLYDVASEEREIFSFVRHMRSLITRLDEHYEGNYPPFSKVYMRSVKSLLEELEELLSSDFYVEYMTKKLLEKSGGHA